MFHFLMSRLPHPRIQEINPCCLEIHDIASNHGHAMHQSSGSDQSISVGAAIGNMQFGATLSNQHINHWNEWPESDWNG